MYLYDNLLKSNLADMTIVIKSVLQIKVNDKEALTTTQIWKDIESLVKENEILIPIQINGKKKSEIKVSSDLQRSELERLALETSEVKAIIKDNEVKKIIVVPGRIINIVF